MSSRVRRVAEQLELVQTPEERSAWKAMPAHERVAAGLSPSLVIPIMLSVIVVSAWSDGWSGLLAGLTAAAIVLVAALLLRALLRRGTS